jgi:hypothetical protein
LRHLKSIIILQVIFCIFFLQPLFSWTNHFIVSHYSLLALPEIQSAKPVKVESFDTFLAKEAVGLATLLDEQEDYARANIENYPPRPNSLKFNPTDKKNLRKNFLQAVRLNPNIKLALFVQKLPNVKLPENQKILPTKISVFEKDEWMDKFVFQALKEGSTVPPSEVAASASDEPDYGHDIGLYTDNESEHGKLYNFGEQPFGDPRKFYGSQAPFHMGFYHEAGIVYSLAGFVKKTHPLYRIYLFSTLAQYAFKTGHDYWGYRFMGWGLHYIGDLTQPYHTALFPGKGTMGLLWINLKDTIGLHSAKSESIERLSDRHTAIEHYEYFTLEKIIKSNDEKNKFLTAFQNTSKDSSYSAYTVDYARLVVSAESNKRADDLDDRIGDSEEVMLFKDREFDFAKFKEDESTKKVDELMENLFNSVGSHTRNYSRGIMLVK